MQGPVDRGQYWGQAITGCFSPLHRVSTSALGKTFKGIRANLPSSGLQQERTVGGKEWRLEAAQPSEARLVPLGSLSPRQSLPLNSLPAQRPLLSWALVSTILASWASFLATVHPPHCPVPCSLCPSLKWGSLCTLKFYFQPQWFPSLNPYAEGSCPAPGLTPRLCWSHL